MRYTDVLGWLAGPCLLAAGMLLTASLPADEVRRSVPEGAGSWMFPETNRAEVKDRLRVGWDVVAFAPEMAAPEYRALMAAVAEGGGEARRAGERLLAVLRREMGTVFGHEMVRPLDTLAPEMVALALEEARHGGRGALCLEGFDLEVGVARYHHWVMLVLPRPRVERTRLGWEFPERNLALPDTYEPYVRLRVRRDPSGILARMSWVGPGVRFVKVMGDRWVRSDAAGSRAYIEMDRGDGYIELRAEDGRSMVRLHDSYMEVRSGASFTWSRTVGGMWVD